MCAGIDANAHSTLSFTVAVRQSRTAQYRHVHILRVRARKQRTMWCSGMFQPMTGQFGCISCDNLGDFYQELEGQTNCTACPPSTQRYLGVLNAANRSACQCKAGASHLPLFAPSSTVLAYRTRYSGVTAATMFVQATIVEMAGPARWVSLACSLP